MANNTDDQQQASTSTTIDSLPSEILCPIINCLPSKDRITATGVSTRWHAVVDQMLGRKLFLGRACQFTPDDEERYKHHYVPINTLGKVGVNTCYVGEIIDPVKSMGNVAFYWMKLREAVFGPNVPTFKYPLLVKNIFFDGPIPPKFFDSITRPAKNLERLDIHLSSLCCLNPANMDLPVFHQLQTLNIWGHKLTQGLFTSFYSPNPILGNLLVLLEHNRFHSLKNFAMEYPFDLKEEAKVTDVLLEFLKGHRLSLEKLKICVNLFITEEPNNFETPEDRVWIQKAKAVSKLLKLKHIEINITSIYRVRSTRMWVGFVESQKVLESAAILTFRLQPDILYRICEQNYRTLVELVLTRLVLNDNGRFTPIHCSVFQTSLALRNLFLEGMPTGLDSPGLTNTIDLPRSLQKVEIGSLLLSSDDAKHIMIGLPNLEEVNLGDIGRQGRVGLTLDTIIEVIRDRRIKSISLYGSINEKFPDGGLSNENPVDPVQITIRPFGMLEIVLGDEGYYIPVPREPFPDIFMDDMD